MKKVLSIIFTAMLALGADAQNTHDIVIWHGTKSQTIQAVDSITFVKSKEKATYIDLGLSVKWGTCNIGAKNPEDFGNFYQWGDVETKESYDWNTYKHGTDRNNLEKYNVKDGKTTLDSEDDAAIVNLNEGWRMPTPEEIKELVNDCTWEWTTVNNVNGYKVTGKNGNSIFLPAAGVMFGKNSFMVESMVIIYLIHCVKETKPILKCMPRDFLSSQINIKQTIVLLAIME